MADFNLAAMQAIWHATQATPQRIQVPSNLKQVRGVTCSSASSVKEAMGGYE
jgi:hypothetical protein